ncbi:MAG: MBL fold metallo-hydrolase [Firmicutes bacterium]|nr:MBL fold metallo-hydrolase [Alicyclobacillaceae bacterium]MCL6496091.1 MBL fold metallo-hydrolase [Bacillota bacterium]
MIWTPFYDAVHGCSSYLVGDEVSGLGVVVDPLAEVGAEEYLLTAQEAGLRVAWVVETHVHADHRSAGRELAEAAGIAVSFHHRAPVSYPVHPLRDGQRLELGDVVLEVWETPGHTEDSLSLLVYDRRRAEEPWGVLTGDSLFVGDVGRPDLAVSSPEAAVAAASAQFDSVRRLLALPEYVAVHPAHFGASACGGIFLSRTPHSTIGFERRHNRLARIEDRQAFVDEVLRHLKPPPEAARSIRAENLGLAVKAGRSA